MVPNSGNNHLTSIMYSDQYIALRFESSNGDYSQLVFYDSGRVSLQRYANHEWKPGVEIRSADSSSS